MRKANAIIARALTSSSDAMRNRNKCIAMILGGAPVAVTTSSNFDPNCIAATHGHRDQHHHDNATTIVNDHPYFQHHHRRRQRQLQPPLLTRQNYLPASALSSSSSSVPLLISIMSMRQTQQRQLSSNPTPGNKVKTQSNKTNNGNNNNNSRSKSTTDDKIPLLNEHLIAELFNKMRGKVGRGEETLSADTYQVRLIVDHGRRSIHDHGAENNTMSNGSASGNGIVINNNNSYNNNQEIEQDIHADAIDRHDDDAHDEDKEDEGETDDSVARSSSSTTSSSSSSSSQASQVTTLGRAISIAHEYELDLMEVTLQVHPPVIKAVNYDKYAYEQRRKQSKAASSKKKRGGGGAISDRPVKEYKFRAGIADHDLNRKARGMIDYLEAGHAVRVTLTARQRSINEDSDAITTTLERVKELVGDKAVEVRGMKANDRNSFGSLLFHPNTKK